MDATMVQFVAILHPCCVSISLMNQLLVKNLLNLNMLFSVAEQILTYIKTLEERLQQAGVNNHSSSTKAKDSITSGLLKERDYLRSLSLGMDSNELMVCTKFCLILLQSM